jgi:hypothetical protein
LSSRKALDQKMGYCRLRGPRFGVLSRTISFCDRHMECLLCLLKHADPRVKANSANSTNTGSTIMKLSEDLLARFSTRINLLRKGILCVSRLEDILRHCRSSFGLFRLPACAWRIHSAKTPEVVTMARLLYRKKASAGSRARI